MKKTLKIIISFLLLFLLLTPIVCFAAEMSDDAAAGEITYQTVFTRAWEFVQENRTEVISGAGSALIIILNAIAKNSNNKKTKTIEQTLEIIRGDSAGTAKNQNSVIGAVNSMIGGYNDMRAVFEKYGLTENERNRLIGAVMVQNTAILEMFFAVFAHNKNTPQSIKDLVTLVYANTKKALGDDKILLDVVEAVKEKVRAESSTESPSDKSHNTGEA